MRQVCFYQFGHLIFVISSDLPNLLVFVSKAYKVYVNLTGT